MRLPRTDSELMLWLNNFDNAFSEHCDTLGFVEADVLSLRADIAMANYLLGDLLPGYKAGLQARTTYKNLVMNGPVATAVVAPPPPPNVGTAPTAVAPGIVPRLRNLIQRIQLAPGYTEAIGADLGITGSDGGPSAPTSTPKPTLKARSTGPGLLQVDFSKDKYDGVVIESRRAGEDGWKSLGVDNYSPFIDDRPPLEAGKPEQREYRARYILRDQATGEWSDIVTATFIP
ncbi:MAG TPA: hypothetical protein VJ866_13850 [Pyrinomonadaceae bacterium]|nr:hypothetical protein [Pyrinomonadaceae bacterium]